MMTAWTRPSRLTMMSTIRPMSSPALLRTLLQRIVKNTYVAGSLPPNAGSRLIGDGPSVPRGGIARCNKGGNALYHFGLSQQGRVTLIRHDDDFKLAAPCQHLIQGGPGQHI